MNNKKFILEIINKLKPKQKEKVRSFLPIVVVTESYGCENGFLERIRFTEASAEELYRAFTAYTELLSEDLLWV